MLNIELFWYLTLCKQNLYLYLAELELFWQTVYSCSTELFEIELTIYIKMDLALNNLQRLICHKTQLTNQYPFSRLLHFTLDTYLIMLSVKEASSTIFWVFGMTWPGIEPQSHGPFVSTLHTRLMDRYSLIIINSNAKRQKLSSLIIRLIHTK